MAMATPTLSVGQTLPRTGQRCAAVVGQTPAAFGFTPVTCRQSVATRTFVTSAGLTVAYCSLDGHEASVRRRFTERVGASSLPALRVSRVDDCPTCVAGGSFAPPHEASSRCESGRRNHCSCSACFD